MKDIINRISALYEEKEQLQSENQNLKEEHQHMCLTIGDLKAYEEMLEGVIASLKEQMLLGFNTPHFLRNSKCNMILIGFSVYSIVLISIMLFGDITQSLSIPSFTIPLLTIVPSCFITYLISTSNRRKLAKNLPSINKFISELEKNRCIILKEIANLQLKKEKIIDQININDELLETFDAYISLYNQLLDQLVENHDLKQDSPEIDTNLKLKLASNFISL